MAAIVFAVAAWQAVLVCLLFAVIYVGSLYVWGGTAGKDRDHPDVIKRRFMSVCSVCLIAPPLLWTFSESSESHEAHTILEWMGLRFFGLIQATVIPLLLTMVLFLGPLYLHYMDGVFRLYLEPRYWSTSLQNYVWLRNHIVAPLSEEFVFRAVMLPLLVPSFGIGWSIFLCPLFFGVAHFHHMIEKVIHHQAEVMDALKQTVFQIFYTTVFGAYSAFLFLRTDMGKITKFKEKKSLSSKRDPISGKPPDGAGDSARVLQPHGFPRLQRGDGLPPAHAHQAHRPVCHWSGPLALPPPPCHHALALLQHSLHCLKPGTKLIALFVIGLVLWLFLLLPVTVPWLYSNTVYTA